MLRFFIIVVSSLLSGCLSRERPVNRADSPEAAVLSARRALADRDLAAYFDTLTDAAARRLMQNSVAICIGQKDPRVAARLRPSLGCEDILARYGWPGAEVKTPEAFQDAAARIRDPRRLAAELEANHRKHKSGTSFAWDYLDNVKISEVKMDGGKANGLAEWSPGDLRLITFEKDETGWRFNPIPEL